MLSVYRYIVSNALYTRRENQRTEATSHGRSARSTGLPGEANWILGGGSGAYRIDTQVSAHSEMVWYAQELQAWAFGRYAVVYSGNDARGGGRIYTDYAVIVPDADTDAALDLSPLQYLLTQDDYPLDVLERLPRQEPLPIVDANEWLKANALAHPSSPPLALNMSETLHASLLADIWEACVLRLQNKRLAQPVAIRLPVDNEADLLPAACAFLSEHILAYLPEGVRGMLSVSCGVNPSHKNAFPSSAVLFTYRPFARPTLYRGEYDLATGSYVAIHADTEEGKIGETIGRLHLHRQTFDKLESVLRPLLAGEPEAIRLYALASYPLIALLYRWEQAEKEADIDAIAAVYRQCSTAFETLECLPEVTRNGLLAGLSLAVLDSYAKRPSFSPTSDDMRFIEYYALAYGLDSSVRALAERFVTALYYHSKEGRTLLDFCNDHLTKAHAHIGALPVLLDLILNRRGTGELLTTGEARAFDQVKQYCGSIHSGESERVRSTVAAFAKQYLAKDGLVDLERFVDSVRILEGSVDADALGTIIAGAFGDHTDMRLMRNDETRAEIIRVAKMRLTPQGRSALLAILLSLMERVDSAHCVGDLFYLQEAAASVGDGFACANRLMEIWERLYPIQSDLCLPDHKEIESLCGFGLADRVSAWIGRLTGYGEYREGDSEVLLKWLRALGGCDAGKRLDSGGAQLPMWIDAALKNQRGYAHSAVSEGAFRAVNDLLPSTDAVPKPPYVDGLRRVVAGFYAEPEPANETARSELHRQMKTLLPKINPYVSLSSAAWRAVRKEAAKAQLTGDLGVAANVSEVLGHVQSAINLYGGSAKEFLEGKVADSIRRKLSDILQHAADLGAFRSALDAARSHTINGSAIDKAVNAIAWNAIAYHLPEREALNREVKSHMETYSDCKAWLENAVALYNDVEASRAPATQADVSDRSHAKAVGLSAQKKMLDRLAEVAMQIAGMRDRRENPTALVNETLTARCDAVALARAEEIELYNAIGDLAFRHACSDAGNGGMQDGYYTLAIRLALAWPIDPSGRRLLKAWLVRQVNEKMDTRAVDARVFLARGIVWQAAAQGLIDSELNANYLVKNSEKSTYREKKGRAASQKN